MIATVTHQTMLHVTSQGLVSNLTSPGEELCPGVNRGTLVGLLFPYPMEAKEHCNDLWDVHVGPPVLNVDVISVRVARLFAWTILVRCCGP